ncbi:MAG: type I glyceraldehyde-3-phosphate dehydrogenase [Chlamydiae bacterium RIFCSPHIGHO2_12_FULL_44_59]|nr:MAG: type I glyceraldehyde-3-phosphate dehydrogenase [Chlamydiae bacterium RIFCSPHIGHO2_01_FULL_44_39]OGN59042.1 MAG: type I glyceraldehyde-3-phosphate dehydrogenase [Chlamydiae bacterium RIFCSPHIGHO2_02_FULL_45_9]OGN60548.1 MAG: type I glyceraldehyde-3-phosphate dehydrogenase [Chlamydiae bacterium RIFCSPHIGHO2_12_FULL_44_59]OGN66020.1 MAG: type I glyceraldehyde-3-phosphate dehydrogenase [Chlamydiae bacterium RIFCSPLOWO2_01_FULL_44_52]OGN68818.1 MAG: type I glyceraldehyde-3-phosphate dehydro
MTKRIAINGFGRIGRLVVRTLLKHPNLEIVAINDLVPPSNLAYLFKYDTVHGICPHEIRSDATDLFVDGKKICVFSLKDPAELPWEDLKIDYVVESTGRFTHLEGAKKHIEAGARRVLISAPGQEGIPTLVVGVNHTTYNPRKDFVVCNASCTTNCLAPLCKVLLNEFGIEEGLMTTVHSLTASQPTVDGPSHKDWRGGRAAGYNIIPASTGAAKAVILALPELAGKLTGMAFRVPTLDVSVVDLTVRLSKDTTYEAIGEAMDRASRTYLQGILATTDEPLVSSDFIGHSSSCIYDKLAGIGLNRRFYKLIAWYDNEMGYSRRVVDLLEYMSQSE